MKKRNLKKAVLLLVASLIFSAAEAAIEHRSAKKATLEIMKIHSGSAFTSCRNTFDNCLVTLSVNPPNEGFVIIQNTSDVDAINVQARLPAAFSDVTQITICPLLKAHETCTLVFVPQPGTQAHPQTTIMVKGDNTGGVFFDMLVLPPGVIII